MTRQSLTLNDITVAEKMKASGYNRLLESGGWVKGQEGHPLKQGFDYFYGYLNQVMPTTFIRNSCEKRQKAHVK